MTHPMSFFKQNYKKIIIAIIIIAIGYFIFKFKFQPSSAETEFNSKTETTITPKRVTIKDEITLTGSVDATNKADLHFQTNGQLAWVGVKVGDTVKKYQAIASLNKDVLQKQLQLDFNNYKTTASIIFFIKT